MVLPRQVTCVRKRGAHLAPHERISHIGSRGWIASEERAIAILEEDVNAFCLETAAGVVYLVVRIHDGRKYLTIDSEEPVPASLLSLSHCPQPQSHYG
jgi:hypothetical protein